jgi:hypothetical protein
MRTVYYVLFFVCLLLLLICVNVVRWLISKLQLALRSVRRGLFSRGREWKRIETKQTNQQLL